MVGGSVAFTALVTNLKQTWSPAEGIAIWGAFAVVVLSILDLVVGFGPSARLHHSLFQRFVTLAADMDKTSEPTTEQFHEWRAHKLMIDHDEPPPFHALYILCKNEVLVAMDTEEAKRFVVRIPFWRRWAAQFFKQPEYQG